MEISAKFDTMFIFIPKIENKPGCGEEITASLYELGVDVEYFQATTVPGREYTDVLIIVKQEDIKRSMAAINSARKKIECGKPVLVNGLTGIIIRGAGVRNSSKFLYCAMKVCAKSKVNVSIVYTTLISINMYVDTRNFNLELIGEIEQELKALTK